MKDLLLKNSAMDDLGLPFKVVVGKLGTTTTNLMVADFCMLSPKNRLICNEIFLGSLTMKIPWQKLYTAPVELHLEKLYLLVTPAYSVVYNEEAEEKAALAAKMKMLEKIEENRQREKLRRLCMF